MRKEKPALRSVPYSRNYSHEQYLFGSMDRALQRDRSKARKQLTSGGTCRPRFSILATSEQWFPNGRQQLRTPPPHLAAGGKSHAGGVTRPGAEGATPGRSRNAAPRSPRLFLRFFLRFFLRRPEAARNPLGDGRFRSAGGADLAAHRDRAFSSQRPQKPAALFPSYHGTSTTGCLGNKTSREAVQG